MGCGAFDVGCGEREEAQVRRKETEGVKRRVIVSSMETGDEKRNGQSEPDGLQLAQTEDTNGVSTAL
jgi:hypothetical protein